MNEVNVICIDLPSSVKGMVVKMFDDGDDYYTIVLNSRMSREQQIATYEHEMEHINERDFDSVIDVQAIEERRHA